MLFPRILHPKLKALAQQYPVITLTGPRQTGKTTLVRQCFPDLPYYSLEDLDTKELAQKDPRGLLGQSKSMIIDKIQKVPSLVSYIQGIVDKSKIKGQFILMGSHQFELTSTISQSLAGRTALIKLLPLSLLELPTLPNLSTLIYRGFYPGIVAQNLNPTEALSFYTATYLERDLKEIKDIRNYSQFETFLKLCASNIGQILNKKRMANDIGVNNKTIDSWFSVLEAGFIVFLLKPHFKNFRKRLVKAPKLYFYDTGLACYLLGIKNEGHVESHPLKGQLFENLVVMEKVKEKFNQVTPHSFYYFRDSSGNEVDLLEERGPKITTYEIKFSKTLTANSFRGLNFYKKLNPDNDQSILIYTGEEKGPRYGHLCLPYNILSSK